MSWWRGCRRIKRGPGGEGITTAAAAPVDQLAAGPGDEPARSLRVRRVREPSPVIRPRGVGLEVERSEHQHLPSGPDGRVVALEVPGRPRRGRQSPPAVRRRRVGGGDVDGRRRMRLDAAEDDHLPAGPDADRRLGPGPPRRRRQSAPGSSRPGSRRRGVPGGCRRDRRGPRRRGGDGGGSGPHCAGDGKRRACRRGSAADAHPVAIMAGRSPARYADVRWHGCGKPRSHA